MGGGRSGAAANGREAGRGGAGRWAAAAREVPQRPRGRAGRGVRQSVCQSVRPVSVRPNTRPLPPVKGPGLSLGSFRACQDQVEAQGPGPGPLRPRLRQRGWRCAEGPPCPAATPGSLGAAPARPGRPALVVLKATLGLG